ncbi:MAG TPA: autotransporter-associated beta strand repeat-containing protein [Tepidisphaeraceae bacterium]|nr:autotransporter-associated beta strand repeat-containing protein [Tepidisphaeraceae bacterium]
MSAKGNGLHFTRGKSATRRSMLIVFGAVSNAAMLSFMAGSAHAQALNTWTSSTSGNWSNGANWLGGSPPTVDPVGNVNLEFNAAGAYTANNDLGPFDVYDTTFDAGNGPTTLTGGDIDLSWPLSEINNPAFTNNSTNPVTIDNNVTFEAPQNVGGTQEYFVLAPGSTTTFNGTMNLTGGSSLKMTNGEATGSGGGPGGTMIWTQPLVFTNNPNGNYGGYFAFRVYEGTLEMAGYTIDDGMSDAPLINVDGVNLQQNTGVASNPPPQTDVYIGPEDYENGNPNDVASFYLLSAGDNMNVRVQVGDAGTITIGGLNTSGIVNFNANFLTLPSDGNGIVNGVSQTIYFSAAAGGTVAQNFAFIRGGGSGSNVAGIDKIGGGTWVVTAGGTSPTGEQAYQGNTTVRDGTLELAYDDTGTNYVTLPADVLSNPGGAYYASGLDGGSLGFNDPTNAVQLGDSGTLSTDNIALLTLISFEGLGGGGARQVLHNINVNAYNPGGTTTIGVGDNGTANFEGNILLNENAVLTGGAGGVANFSGNITGVGGINVNGTGTVDLSGSNTYAGGTTVSGGTLIAAVSGALPNGEHLVNNGTTDIYGNVTLGANGVTALSGTGTLNIGNGTHNVVQLAVGSGGATQGGLTIAGISSLDIGNNHIILSDPSGSIDSTIRGYLASGYDNGSWNGAGIMTSSATGTKYGIGYADGADGGISGITSGQLEVKYTLYGDANLDGSVNSIDFGDMAANFGKSGKVWDQGDFNYDGTVNSIDFGLLAGNFGKSVGGNADVTSADWAALDAFAAANGLMADVPEPGTAALALMAGVGLLHRRRRASAGHSA